MAVMALLANAAGAEEMTGQADGQAPSADTGQAWHGRHRGGGGNGGGDGGNGGNVIIGLPYPPEQPSAPAPYPGGPYPYPASGPPLPGPAAGDGTPVKSWPVWYFCNRPGGYYPYVKVCNNDWQRLPIAPPPPGSGAPVAYGLWERCDDPEGYFPYVQKCQHRWTALKASSPVPSDDPEGIAVIGQWYYCEDAKDYLPYVGSCPHVWREIPAIPPPNMNPVTNPTGSKSR